MGRVFALHAGLILGLLAAGCEDTRYYNTVRWLEKSEPAERQPLASLFMFNNYYYPVRDLFDSRVLASLHDGTQPRAMDLDAAGDVPDSSFYTHRTIGKITPAQAGRGAATIEPPQPPWTIEKDHSHVDHVQFTGRDARGRKFFVKVDDPAYPEAGSAASVISARVLWLLGYNVSANFPVILRGTGRSDWDGRRAEASLFVGGKGAPHGDFDSFRYRREVRGLRVAGAWLDDLDRVSDNTLIARDDDGRYRWFLIDFDSTLGLWQGRPKQPWQGHRYIWDPNWALAEVVTLGALERGQIKHREPVSASVGVFYADDFDPQTWKTQQPNSPYRFMTREDAAWMAGKISQITPEQLRAIVHAAEYSHSADEEYVYKTMLARQAKIVAILDQNR